MNHAYVAGLIDGEGCIHLGVRNSTYRGRVSVGMTQPALPLLNVLRAEWAGSIYQLRPETDRWAAAYTWSVQGLPTVRLLTAISPFLVLKREQAQLVLQVEAIRAALSRRPNNRGGVWTDQARAECEAIKAQLHLLNSKGPRADVLSAEVA